MALTETASTQQTAPKLKCDCFRMNDATEVAAFMQEKSAGVKSYQSPREHPNFFLFPQRTAAAQTLTVTAVFGDRQRVRAYTQRARTACIQLFRKKNRKKKKNRTEWINVPGAWRAR